MLVDKALHEVRIAFIDEIGNEFSPRDMVLSGYWYEARNPSSRSYTLRDDRQPSYVFLHLILAAHFSMPPCLHHGKGAAAWYELQSDVQGIILNALNDTQLFD
jgi:hypothetical protein